MVGVSSLMGNFNSCIAMVCDGQLSPKHNRRQKLFGMNTNDAYGYPVIPNSDLDTILTHLLRHSPNSGEAYVLRSLRSRGVKSRDGSCEKGCRTQVKDLK